MLDPQYDQDSNECQWLAEDFNGPVFGQRIAYVDPDGTDVHGFAQSITDARIRLWVSPTESRLITPQMLDDGGRLYTGDDGPRPYHPDFVEIETFGHGATKRHQAVWRRQLFNASWIVPEFLAPDVQPGTATELFGFIRKQSSARKLGVPWELHTGPVGTPVRPYRTRDDALTALRQHITDRFATVTTGPASRC